MEQVENTHPEVGATQKHQKAITQKAKCIPGDNKAHDRDTNGEEFHKRMEHCHIYIRVGQKTKRKEYGYAPLVILLW